MQQPQSVVLTCPTAERSLFEGSFSAALRELILGSSRSDVLSAIRGAKLGDWKIAPESGEVMLKTDRATAMFDTKATGESPWIRAETPHGEFSLLRDHWIAQQIGRRIERRLNGDGYLLARQGPQLVRELIDSAAREEQRLWTREERLKVHYKEPLLAADQPGFSTNLRDGFRATVASKWSGGEIPLSAAISDGIRFQMEMDYHHRMQGFPGSSPMIPGSYCGSGFSSSAAYIQPPLAPGPWFIRRTEISIQHDGLNRLRSTFGLERIAVYADQAFNQSGDIKREKAVDFEKVLKQAERSRG